ncbi:MAG: metallopeptidase family protein, partial [Gaiellales bacterium]
DEAEVREEIRITVLHEVAHHFGISDERLDELGWG